MLIGTCILWIDKHQEIDLLVFFFNFFFFFMYLFCFNCFHHEGVGHTTEWGSKLSVYLTEALWEWSVLFKNTKHCPGQVLKPGPFDPDSSALTNLNHCTSSSWFLSNLHFLSILLLCTIFTHVREDPMNNWSLSKKHIILKLMKSLGSLS